MRKYWTTEEIELLKIHYPSMDKYQLENLFNRTWKAIKDKANKEKIYRVKGNEGLSILLENTPVSFYWVGFLLADGSFTNNGLSLELSTKDIEHLKKFCSFIKTTNFYSRTRVLNDKEYYQCSTSVINTNIIPEIRKKFDISNNKTKNPPNISNYCFKDELILSLFIGFIDGDGSITKSENNSSRLRIETDIAWLDNLIVFETILYSYFNQCTRRTTGLLSKKTSRGSAKLEITNTQYLRELNNFAINNALPLLKRKWGII